MAINNDQLVNQVISYMRGAMIASKATDLEMTFGVTCLDGTRLELTMLGTPPNDRTMIKKNFIVVEKRANKAP